MKMELTIEGKNFLTFCLFALIKFFIVKERENGIGIGKGIGNVNENGSVNEDQDPDSA